MEFLIPALLVLASARAGASPVAPAPALVAENGRALMPVVISAKASPRVEKAASDLVALLGRISGARFGLERGDGARGIAVGRADDFPALDLARVLDAEGLERREQHLLRSHAGGVALLGAEDAGAEDAVWGLLQRLGYRQYFPGPRWEFVPRSPSIRIDVDAKDVPSFLTRDVWYGLGTLSPRTAAYDDWIRKNRGPGSFSLNTGHAYETIIERNKQEFQAHPEYLGLLKGKRRSSKFCVSNPGLRRLVAEDARRWAAAHPGQDSVSVEPSDEAGWCECAKCDKIGGPTERTLLLAQEAAAALRSLTPAPLAAFYAYYTHSPPPKGPVGPGILVTVATQFLQNGATVEEVLDGWKRAGAGELGIREYYAVFQWDHDLPGQPRATLDYLRSTIPAFRRRGIRLLSAEASDNWGAAGLPYYVAMRLLWDVRDAARVGAIREEFFQRAFGPAREPMRAYYRALEPGPAQTDKRVKVMYGALRDAYALSNGGPEGLRARLDDLLLYARYAELYAAYENATADRQTRFEAVVRHAWRMRESVMVHVRPLFTVVPWNDRKIRLGPDDQWDVPAPKNRLKDERPFTREELDALLAAGGRKP
ncbi:MAG: DUF4838 domain-containing protein [Elusimicrobia bacterium]|nr:DUF4838 domain-containing protein [Elusimicrobiota bacterium]